MKIFKAEEYRKLNPAPDQRYVELFIRKDKARDLGGILVAVAPGSEVPYHYHERRDELIVVIDGEATEILDGKEITIKTGDVVFIPTGEKHSTVNGTNRPFRYLEFFNGLPLWSDYVEAK